MQLTLSAKGNRLTVYGPLTYAKWICWWISDAVTFRTDRRIDWLRHRYHKSMVRAHPDYQTHSAIVQEMAARRRTGTGNEISQLAYEWYSPLRRTDPGDSMARL